MNTIYTALIELSSTTSKLEKLDTLRRHTNNEDLQYFFKLVFNPYTNFFIRKIPVYDTNRGNSSDVVAAMKFVEENFATRKLTGNAAKDALKELLETLDSEGQEVLKRVIEKDAKCGVSGDTANKIWDKLIPTYPCLLASAFDEKVVKKIFDKPGKKYTQNKSDGTRVNIIINENGVVSLFTRAGRELDVLGRFDSLGSIASLRSKVIDGELLTISTTGKFNNRQTSNGICSKAVKGTMSEDESKILHATIWDIVDLDDFKNYSGKKTYDERFAELLGVTENNPQIINLVSVIETEVVENLEQAWKFYQKKLEEGEEGALLKHGSMLWEDKRSKMQVKLKNEIICSLRVSGFKEGKGVLEGNLGALSMESEDSIIQVNISGFTLKTRSEIYANLTGNAVTYKVMGKNGWEDVVANPGDIDVSIGSIVDVMYNQKIQERGGTWSLFLPRFDSVRFDKTQADFFDHVK